MVIPALPTGTLGRRHKDNDDAMQHGALKKRIGPRLPRFAPCPMTTMALETRTMALDKESKDNDDYDLGGDPDVCGGVPLRSRGLLFRGCAIDRRRKRLPTTERALLLFRRCGVVW